jgi:hypothetical protein
LASCSVRPKAVGKINRQRIKENRGVSVLLITVSFIFDD